MRVSENRVMRRMFGLMM